MESTNEQPAIDQPDITKGEPWFDDGNVVLIAEGTAFCVHKSQLARRSEVFEGLFAVPHTDSSLQSYENRGVVVLQDKADDLRSLLVALYDGIELRSQRNMNDFPAIAQVARMSHKYMTQSLHQTILRYLITINPVKDMQLDEWHARQKSHGQSDGEPWPYFHPSLMIRLAKDIQAEFLLPFAYYPMAIRAAHDNFFVAVNTPARGQLSKSDLIRIMVIQDEFKNRMAAFLVDLMGAQKYVGVGKHGRL